MVTMAQILGLLALSMGIIIPFFVLLNPRVSSKFRHKNYKSENEETEQQPKNSYDDNNQSGENNNNN